MSSQQVVDFPEYPGARKVYQCMENCCSPVLGNCGVPGCSKCPPFTTHYCARCCNVISNHRRRHCPVRFAGIYVMVPIQETRTSPTGAQETVTVDYYVLCQLRCKSLGGYILGCGGGVGKKENAKYGAMRELLEEAGLDLLAHPNNGVHMFYASDTLACYYAMMNEIPRIFGADQSHAWEVDQTFEPADCVGAITLPGTGHAWLPLSQILGWLHKHPNWQNDKFVTMIKLLREKFLDPLHSTSVVQG